MSQVFSSRPEAPRRLVELASGAHDVRLRAARVVKLQEPGNRLERHVVTVMQREDRALDSIEGGGEEVAEPLPLDTALGELLGAGPERRYLLEHFLAVCWRPATLDPAERFVSNDRVQPGRKARRPFERAEVPMGLEEDVLCEVRRRVPVACEPEAPTRHTRVVPLEQLVHD